MENIIHRCINKDEIRELCCGYRPYILNSKYYIIKRNYCSKDGDVCNFFVNRYPIDCNLLRERDNYELLFFQLKDGDIDFINSLYGENYQISTNRQINLLYRLTNQQLIVWIKKGLGKFEKQDAKEYIERVNTTKCVSNHAIEVLQRFTNYKFGISNLYLPGQISILTTNKCNADCIHCYRRNNIFKEEKLSPELFQKLLVSIAESEITSVNLLGGEPLLREDIFEIIRKSQELKLQLKITTNAIRLADENFVRKIVKDFDNTLSFFQISIDGVGEYQNKLRRGADWNLMEKAFINLKKNNVRFQTNTVVTKPLYEKIEEYFLVMSGLGIPEMRFTMLKQCGKGNEFNSLVLTPKEIESAIVRIDELSKKYQVSVTNGLRNPIFMYQDIPTKYQSKAYQTCNALNYQMTISYNLDYLPCEFYEPFSEAWGENYFEMDISTFWNKSALIPKFRKYELVGKCTRCKYNLFCSKGCPVETTYLTGANNHSNPLCWYDPDKARQEQMYYPDYNYLDLEVYYE